jgi:alpha-galactosidase
MAVNAAASNVASVGDLTFDIRVTDRGGRPVAISTTVEPIERIADTWLVRMTEASADDPPIELDQVSLRWTAPAIDMHGFYGVPPSPEDLARLPFWSFERRSAAHTGAPFFSLFHRNGQNRHAVGLVDQVVDAALHASLSEATRTYSFEWSQPIRLATGSPWAAALFVSRSARPWPEVLRAYVETVDIESETPRLPVPPGAYDPVFCTWTAVHHDISDEWVVRNAGIAADLGFGTWLTDDGWFNEGGTFADYQLAGDWRPSPQKFPDMAAHVRAVRELGLRYVLWVAPFMVGHASAAANEHRALLEDATEDYGFRNLSPRRAETAPIVEKLLGRLVSELGLDGLKVDFIDMIGTTPDLPPTDRDPTAGVGVYSALTRAIEALARDHPGVLVEVRNTYANLAARRYANLYRASDVPLNFAANRWQVTMLRLLVPDRAVHLDPALWHPGDTDENVAVHLINVISSVPTIGVELERYPKSHLDLIRHWLRFYRDHRDTIVHGTFRPEIRLGQVPVTRFEGPDELIVGLYDDVAVALDSPLPTWLLNASTQPFVDLLPGTMIGWRQVIRHGRLGEVEGRELIAWPVSRLAVDVGGSLEIRAPASAAIEDRPEAAA